MATSVTQRIKEIKQPTGGYLPIKQFSVKELDDGQVLAEDENISANLVGMCVDYLTRYIMGKSARQAFRISLAGAAFVEKKEYAEALIGQIKGLDNKSITCACKLVGYDVCLRSGLSYFKPVEGINPDKDTIRNIRIMVERSVNFFEVYGVPIRSELTFEGGYTNTVTDGDGDFMTEDTLWDFKVTKSRITSKHTLQILMYYIMGMHSIHDEYKKIKKLGFFNPRANTVYLCSVDAISKEVIEVVSKEVIGYSAKRNEKTTVKKSEPCNNEYTVQDICQMLGVTRHYVYKYIDSGKLLAHKRGNKYFIYRDDYTILLERLKAERRIMWIILGIVIGFSVLFLCMLFMPLYL